MKRCLLLLSILLLAACAEQGPRNLDYDASRDFAAYRSWGWVDPAIEYRPNDPRIRSDLTEQRLREAVSGGLDQRGLRPAAGGTRADLKVKLYVILDQRQQSFSYSDPYWGGGWGGPWGPGWGPGPWGPGYVRTQTVTYPVMTVQLDLLDGRDGKLVWRASEERLMDDQGATPAQRSAAFGRLINELLTRYPPRP
ncbi:DUF4136 domain-containing protein [Pseudomonas sp. No.117]